MIENMEFVFVSLGHLPFQIHPFPCKFHKLIFLWLNKISLWTYATFSLTSLLLMGYLAIPIPLPLWITQMVINMGTQAFLWQNRALWLYAQEWRLSHTTVLFLMCWGTSIVGGSIFFNTPKETFSCSLLPKAVF